jgi:hypothetical protein
VLIAMGILTVGLLGVAAIFPVAGFYMQRGEVADRSSAIAQAAFNDAVSRGVLNPENWLVWEDGNVRGAPTPQMSISNSFTRPFARTLREQQAALTGGVPRDIQKTTALEFGSVFVIDPLAIASVALTDPMTNENLRLATQPVEARCGAVFPASSVWAIANYGGLPPGLTGDWWPWGDSISAGPRWPIRRVSLRQPLAVSPSYRPLDATLADKQFTTSDDLALDVPTAQDKPSIQRLQLANFDGLGPSDDPLARQSRGDYSWIVTVSPNTAEARNALATNPAAYPYEVSVVVFHKRPIGLTSPADLDDIKANREFLSSGERACRASIISTGLSGGEILLTRQTPGSSLEPEESPFDILKVGNWIMLCGPHPNSTAARPMMTARWYRVLAIEGKNERLNSNGSSDPPPLVTDPERRLVSLRGPQWPWQPNTYSGSLNLADDTKLSNSLYVCIPTGAVAVHSKTIHLEGNSVWSGGANGLSPPPPPGPKYGFD